ncbi:MAG: Fibronectin type protein [Modestobacter sp.]|nr:Fibronectin type protein [Modestobacter sp.]
MRFTSPSRRAAGLLAATTIGLSTAVLSVTGVASAATTTYTFSTDSGAAADQPGITRLTMSGDCTVDWDLVGGAGGAGADIDGAIAANPADHYVVTTTASDGQVFDLYPGDMGGDASYATEANGTGGTNDSGIPGSGGTDGAYDMVSDTFGGGGGASSEVLLSGASTAPYVSAAGGDGSGVMGGSGGGVSTNNADALASVGPASGTGAGVIGGTVTCVTPDVIVSQPAVPTAPTDLSVRGGDGSLDLRFFPGESDGTNDPTGWQYSLDGGDWASFQPTAQEQYSAALTGVVTGLTNGTEYSVRVRGTNTVGGGAPSAAATGTPAQPSGAPTNVVVTAGAGSLKVIWSAPTAAGTYPIAGYEVYLSAGENGGNACTTTADDRTCLIGVESGHTYGIVVVPLDDHGNPGAPSGSVSSGTVPFPAEPATVPSADGTIQTNDSDNAVTAGQDVTLTGSGYLPGSTVDLIVYSTPTKVGSAVADADGSFTATVTLPAGLVNGEHHLVAAGVDANGNPRYLVTAITVSGGTAATATGGLAYTGFSALPFVGGGLLALLAGAGLLVASRRRAS